MTELKFIHNMAGVWKACEDGIFFSFKGILKGYVFCENGIQTGKGLDFWVADMQFHSAYSVDGILEIAAR